ncbi:hypothetical protein GCM10011312_02930 [Planktosalinus lacus]|uniref:VOC domain-containing protein n=1 Tax=Planktosalinus lacus TaxID=1526573 RepID=A0A8J2V825_9FLAO|nr:hypothetical protein GCM10011312_02930 [Planktosalinus lacus]
MKILHLDKNHPLLFEQLSQLGFQNDEDYTSSKEEVEAKINNYEGIVIRSRFDIDKTFLDAAKNLKFIARVGAGLESIDVEYAESKNITLIAAPEGNRNAVGEHALGMLLLLFNNLKQADSELKQGLWNREANRGTELDGKTVGIIGYGNMGKAFAKKLRGFEVEVLCYDIKENVGDQNAKQVTLEELQEKTDVLSLHIPWTEATDKMVNASFISKFKKPFWLLNTARGKCVVTTDLVQALKSGKILGAGLDVLEYEKGSFESLFTGNDLPEALQELMKMDNVLLSPHIAGWTVESKEKLAQVIVDKIKQLYGFGDDEKKILPPKEYGVSGLGGFFFKTKDPDHIKAWYKEHLGMNTDQYGWTFWWKDKEGNDCSTQWSPFKEDTNYFAPSEKPYMMNLRVKDLHKLLNQLKEEGVTVVGEVEEFSYGKFGWILDPEGNKLELWEPNDRAFL